MPSQPGQHKRRWRQYKTANGNEPVREFLFQISAADRAEIATAMKEVEDEGLSAARHLRGNLYEVRADGQKLERPGYYPPRTGPAAGA